MPLSIVKVGGSLLADGGRLHAILGGLAAGSDGACIVVPGGGPFADAVRTAQAALGFDDALAHRLGLDAMGRVAEVFAAIEPRLGVARSVPDTAEIVRRGGTPVWDPVALKTGHATIAESWSVTSDSLALWLAIETRAARCVLIKSVDQPVGASLSDLARLGIVDPAFPDLAKEFPGTIVVRGPCTSVALKAAA